MTKDDSKVAAITAKSLLKTFNSTDTSYHNSKLKNELLSILEKVAFMQSISEIILAKFIIKENILLC